MVLVIDDDAFMREAIIDTLGYAAISLLTAASGQEGITLYREHLGKIKLVLLDMSMPGLDGVETFRGLYEIDNDVRVLLLSGYTNEEINEKFPKGSILGFLQKPYKLKELISIVRHYL